MTRPPRAGCARCCPTSSPTPNRRGSCWSWTPTPGRPRSSTRSVRARPSSCTPPTAPGPPRPSPTSSLRLPTTASERSSSPRLVRASPTCRERLGDAGLGDLMLDLTAAATDRHTVAADLGRTLDTVVALDDEELRRAAETPERGTRANARSSRRVVPWSTTSSRSTRRDTLGESAFTISRPRWPRSPFTSPLLDHESACVARRSTNLAAPGSTSWRGSFARRRRPVRGRTTPAGDPWYGAHDRVRGRGSSSPRGRQAASRGRADRTRQDAGRHPRRVGHPAGDLRRRLGHRLADDARASATRSRCSGRRSSTSRWTSTWLRPGSRSVPRGAEQVKLGWLARAPSPAPGPADAAAWTPAGRPARRAGLARESSARTGTASSAPEAVRRSRPASTRRSRSTTFSVTIWPGSASGSSGTEDGGDLTHLSAASPARADQTARRAPGSPRRAAAGVLGAGRAARGRHGGGARRLRSAWRRCRRRSVPSSSTSGGPRSPSTSPRPIRAAATTTGRPCTRPPSGTGPSTASSATRPPPSCGPASTSAPAGGWARTPSRWSCCALRLRGSAGCCRSTTCSASARTSSPRCTRAWR